MPRLAPVTPPLQSLRDKGFDVLFLSHARSILEGEFPEALIEIERVLSAIELPISEIIGAGGGETQFTQRLRRARATLNWKKHIFEIGKTIDGVPRESTSHEVDHVKRYVDAGVVAMEIEWNNKDPFYDRDLENFKRLHAEGAISVGIIITRGQSLQESLWDAVHRFATEREIDSIEKLSDNGVAPTPKQRANILKRVVRNKDPVPFATAWADNFVGNKFGQATTHWSKLMHRVERGVGNPCPLLLIGLPASIIVFDGAKVEPLSEEDATDGSEAA